MHDLQRDKLLVVVNENDKIAGQPAYQVRAYSPLETRTSGSWRKRHSRSLQPTTNWPVMDNERVSARFRARRQLVNRVVGTAADWAAGRQDVRSAIVVGSYAYGRPRMSSDVDLVFLADDVEKHLESLDFVSAITPRSTLVRSAQWGPMHERRVRLPGGLLVEFGITTPAWVDEPVDPGTARVVTDGCKILYDEELVSAALLSLGLPPERWATAT